METMRFLMVTTHYPPQHIGGDAVYVRNLSEELVARGHEVHVATCPQVFELMRGGGPQESKDSPKDNRFPEVHPIRFRSPRTAILKSHVLGMWGRAEESLRDLVSRIGPDVVHWNNTKAFIGTPFSSSRAVNVYLAHDFFALCPKSSLLRPTGIVCPRPSFCQTCLLKSYKLPQIWRMGSRRVLRIPRDFRIISHSAFLAKVLSSDGIQPSHIIPTFAPDPGLHDIGKPDTRNSVVFIGILEPHKGPEVLLEAFALSARQQSLTLEIIGEGSLRDKLTKRAMELGVRDRVKIPGRVSRDEIGEAMKRARAVIVPSVWYENCPLSAIEALSFGVPIVASDIGGLPEIATAGAGSTTFGPGDVSQLARELVKTDENGGTLSDRIHLARKEYEKRYSPARHVEMYMKMLR